MVRDELSVLSAFLAVAEERSFTRAARRLRVSPSALSHAMRGLEERIGVRLVVPRTASMTGLAPSLGPFARDYPDVVLDVTVDDHRLDLVAAGFDAGIQLGEFIQQDMVAVRLSRDYRPPEVRWQGPSMGPGRPGPARSSP
jgi:DNA-binding transcriptional LysR family regulator